MADRPTDVIGFDYVPVVAFPVQTPVFDIFDFLPGQQIGRSYGNSTAMPYFEACTLLSTKTARSAGMQSFKNITNVAALFEIHLKPFVSMAGFEAVFNMI
uniref:RES domain-containing protein n=1 Tax=Panagrellus redivivus TaxID=6233 RepID=A0A7E4VNL3_PANRE